MSSEREGLLAHIPLNERMSPASVDLLLRNLPQIIAQDTIMRKMDGADLQNQQNGKRQSLAGILLMATFMAAGAVALLSYANDLDGGNGRFYRTQMMLGLVFEYNLAVVALGILVPLIRAYRGKGETISSSWDSA
ncbi:hypothetical protein BDV93DRAFT_566025 [Ceratobasidium sp. AG-I]|nr:hypothetical protein BDV93DRAFT_566025 [Ceratobasidium sp. AG-I]